MTEDRAIAIATAALRWIAEHDTDEGALHELFEACGNEFHGTRPPDDARCPNCFSRWWDISGEGPSDEGSYTLGGVAAKALAEIESEPASDEEQP
jgi:hypothetical protein